MTSWPGNEEVGYVLSDSDFEVFFEQLISARNKPMVVISIPEDAAVPEADVNAIVEELGDTVTYVLLPSRATYQLTEALGGKEFSVHSGWVRIYPSSPGWRTRELAAPNFRPSPINRARTTRRVVDAALNILFQEGSGQSARNPDRGERTMAVVENVITATQVLVDAGGRRQAVMRTDRLRPGVRSDRLVRRGQTFMGILESKGLMFEFTPDPVPDEPLARTKEFVGDGIVTSALVVDVRRDDMRLQLHPEVEITISQSDNEDLTTYASPGDVVTVEVIPYEADFICDFSDEDPSPAVSLIPDGPPWIVADVPAEESSATTDSDPELGPDNVGDSPANELEIEIERLERLLEVERDEKRELRRELRRSRRLTIPVVYSDREAQFRLEAHLDYLTRVPEGTRTEFPWPERFLIGDGFLDSVDGLVRAGGISREKIVEVCADVLCGQARRMSSRAVKEWTESKQGPQLTRPADGAVAWRVRLQTGSSAARRLKYWQHHSGTLELGEVTVHDEGIS